MSWEPINLAHLEERPPIVPDLGGVGLIYPGKRHVFSGPPESAKTIFAYIVAIETARQGGRVLLVDFEMGQWSARDRLRELGATDDDFEQILYIEPETPATKELISTLIDTWRPTLAVIDAAAGAFDLQGLDDNKRADVERFASVYVRLLSLHEIASIVVDHVVKDARNRGGFVIGSERKVGGADVHLGFETVKPLYRGGRGIYRIATRKDREGHLPRPTAARLELVSDPVTHAITWELTDTRHDETGEPFRPTVLMERVSRYLELQSEPVSRTMIEETVTGKLEYLRIAMDVLAREGYVDEIPGPRRARLLVSVQAFRDDSVPTPSPHSVPDSVPEESLNGAGSHSVPDSVPTPSRDSVPSFGGVSNAPKDAVDPNEVFDNDIPF